MPLPAGTRLGPYDVISPIGVGGMGEVYRARDTTLGRDVALKILPDAFALDADRRTRFAREARVLASLNHPNIAHIYGVEENALVMEFVEGEDLAERLRRGAIPLADALPIARQIAEALEYAHEQGIVHRDLKPANVKVRDDGVVKVLDFGLAKAIDPAAASAVDAMTSPTITARATALGTVMGTAAYMSPEQAKGKAVDKRADVWAFGAVLYEMVTGRRAFQGEDVTDILTAVMRDTPDWQALPSTAPPRLQHLLERCFERDVNAAREPGRRNVLFVEPFPPTGSRFPVSPLNDDAHHPVWSPDGNDLFYTPGVGTRMTRLPVMRGAAFAFGQPTTLNRPFANNAGSADRPYDLTRDGKRFLSVTDLSTEPGQGDSINVVVNWFADLRAKVGR